MHRQVESLSQRLYQLRSSSWPQQTRHILDCDYVCPSRNDLIGERKVVVERVKILGWV
jgi:hypothetical protein